MLKIRLQRIGRKNNPSYRVVVVDSRQGPKSGKSIDLLGSYNPQTDHVKIDGEKAKDWIAKGVQPSPTVHNLLINQGVIEGKKVNVLSKKSPIVSETAEEEAAPAAAEVAEGDGAAEATDAPAEESPAEASDDASETEDAPAEEAGTEASDEAATEETEEAKTA